MRPTLRLRSLLLPLLLCLLLSGRAAAAICPGQLPKVAGSASSLSVAIVVFGPEWDACISALSATCLDAEPMRLPDNPLTFNFSQHPYATQFYQAWRMYEERVQQRGVNASIPLIDGGAVALNISWWSVGPALHSDAPARTAAVVERVTHGGFSFVVPPVFGSNELALLFQSGCERTRQCLAVAPTASETATWVCDSTVSQVPQLECAGKRKGDRRFEYSLSALWDARYNAASHLDLFRAHRLRTMVILRESGSNDESLTEDMAFSRGFDVQLTVQLDEENTLRTLNRTAEDLAQQIMELNPDMLLIFARAFSYPLYPFNEIVAFFKEQRFTPRSIVWAGGYEYALQTAGVSIDYSLGTIPSIPQLRGINYRATNDPGTNFEVYPANATHDCGAVFQDAWVDRWGVPPFGVSGYVWPLLATHVMLIMQKLVEHAQSTDVESLRAASQSISVPSLYTRIQFDLVGRTVLTNEISIQHVPDVSSHAVSFEAQPQLNGLQTRVLTPAWLADELIFPQPTYDERVFAPGFYQHAGERVMIAITCLCYCYLAAWLLFLKRSWNEPVVRASIPEFLLMVVLGCCLFLASNFITGVFVTTATCNTTIQFWTLGFTLCFSALFGKSWRIFAVVKSNLLTVGANYQRNLIAAVLTLCAIDIIVNVCWATLHPMHADLIVPDPYRPSNSYYQCSHDSSWWYALVYFHLCIKATVILSGMCVTWLVRGVSQAFNDSNLLMGCVYTAAIVGALVVPILNFLGNKTRSEFSEAMQNGTVPPSSLQNRLLATEIFAAAICFLAVSIPSILLVPKYLQVCNAVHSLGIGTRTHDHLHGPESKQSSARSSKRRPVRAPTRSPTNLSEHHGRVGSASPSNLPHVPTTYAQTHIELVRFEAIASPTQAPSVTRRPEDVTCATTPEGSAAPAPTPAAAAQPAPLFTAARTAGLSADSLSTTQSSPRSGGAKPDSPELSSTTPLSPSTDRGSSQGTRAASPADLVVSGMVSPASVQRSMPAAHMSAAVLSALTPAAARIASPSSSPLSLVRSLATNQPAGFTSASSAALDVNSRRLRLSNRQLNLLHVTPDTPAVSRTSDAPVRRRITPVASTSNAIGVGSLVPAASFASTAHSTRSDDVLTSVASSAAGGLHHRVASTPTAAAAVAADRLRRRGSVPNSDLAVASAATVLPRRRSPSRLSSTLPLSLIPEMSEGGVSQRPDESQSADSSDALMNASGVHARTDGDGEAEETNLEHEAEKTALART